MKRLTLFFALLMVACTTPSYPGIDNPTRKPNSLLDKDIIAYIDQRLGQEYYWLDEVEQKSHLFDREYCTWNEYLANSLSRFVLSRMAIT